MKNTSVAEFGASDEFGYPIEIPDGARFISPVKLAPNASLADHKRHAAAYAAYQERFLRAFRAARRLTHDNADEG